MSANENAVVNRRSVLVSHGLPRDNTIENEKRKIDNHQRIKRKESQNMVDESSVESDQVRIGQAYTSLKAKNS